MKQQDLLNWLVSAISQDPDFAKHVLEAVAWTKTEEFQKQVQAKAMEAQARSTQH